MTPKKMKYSPKHQIITQRIFSHEILRKYFSKNFHARKTFFSLHNFAHLCFLWKYTKLYVCMLINWKLFYFYQLNDEVFPYNFIFINQMFCCVFFLLHVSHVKKKSSINFHALIIKGTIKNEEILCFYFQQKYLYIFSRSSHVILKFTSRFPSMCSVSVL